MSVSPISYSSGQQLLPDNNGNGSFENSLFLRDPSTISTKDIQFPKLLENNSQVEEQTLVQVEFVNDDLLRKKFRSELASKNAFLTRRWQTTLVISLTIFSLAAGIGGIAYWLTLQTAITQPFLLYGATCYMNSRSCDATRMLWCPAGVCICTGNYQWNATAQNCTCGQYQIWTGLQCIGYGYYGDPCNTVPCRPTLTCSVVVNQTYTTGQDICSCDNATYLDTSGGSNNGNCIPRVSYGVTCKTNFDCENWLGLTCTGVGGGNAQCLCDSTAYWNGSTCAQNALGWEYCSVTVPCDTTRGLTCAAFNLCECDNYSYWDNVTTIWCQQKKTYSISCQFTFQCNTTVNLSCPTISTGCNCPTTSYALICDCQLSTFWDGQRCTPQHSFNGTCPGQYACTSNLVCYAGHCICPGNMGWDIPTPNTCACTNGTVWNNILNTCQ